MNASSHCEFSPTDFSAIATETSDTRIVHVSGSGLCPTAGWDLRLAPANPGVVPHPDTLWLDLRERQPRRGSRSSRNPTVTSVDAIIEDTSAERIVIRFGWREGFAIPVRTAAGTRPTRRRPRELADAAARRHAASGRVPASVG